MLRARQVHTAAQQGDVELLKSFLETSSFDPNLRDRHGKTPLHESCSRGHVDCVRLLLNHGALVSCRKSNGFTPLLHASANGHDSIVALLLSSGANPLEADMYGETAFHLAARAGWTAVLSTLLNNIPPVSDKLLSIKRSLADLHLRSFNGRTPLHCSARNGQVLALKWLLEHGVDPSIPDSTGTLPVHEAAGGGHVACMQLLINGQDSISGNSAFLNAADASNCTPLHHASSGGHVHSVQKLLELGADISARDSNGASPLYWAASQGRTEVVSLLLEYPGVDPNTCNYHRSALHVAAGWGHVATVAVLLKGRADPLSLDSDGLTVEEFVKSLPTRRQSATVLYLLENWS